MKKTAYIFPFLSYVCRAFYFFLYLVFGFISLCVFCLMAFMRFTFSCILSLDLFPFLSSVLCLSCVLLFPISCLRFISLSVFWLIFVLFLFHCNHSETAERQPCFFEQVVCHRRDVAHVDRKIYGIARYYLGFFLTERLLYVRRYFFTRHLV